MIFPLNFRLERHPLLLTIILKVLTIGEMMIHQCILLIFHSSSQSKDLYIFIIEFEYNTWPEEISFSIRCEEIYKRYGLNDSSLWESNERMILNDTFPLLLKLFTMLKDEPFHIKSSSCTHIFINLLSGIFFFHNEICGLLVSSYYTSKIWELNWPFKS